jgi:broad specificity phosphatase PhoE
VSLGLAFVLGVNTAMADGIFSIFLVRHAEKELADAGADDPALTDCGRRRARHLARLFATIPIERIYSTDYQRTRDTVAPLARANDLQPEIYSTDQLPELAEKLGQRRQDVLVVGHSNTTGVLAGMLAGEQWAPYGEDIYDRLYQVIDAGGERRVYLFQQGFECTE